MQSKFSKTDIKRKREQLVVAQMIKIYCRKKHHLEGGFLCLQCQELTEYAKQRSINCPRMENKTFCSNCKIHCYRQDKRENIRKVMRFSGPRIFFYHPFMTLWHITTGIQEKYLYIKETLHD